MNLPRGAVDLDECALLQVLRCTLDIDHTREAELTGHHGRMGHGAAEFGDHGCGVAEGGGIADVGDLGDQDFARLQVIDGFRTHDPHSAADPATADADSAQCVPGPQRGRRSCRWLPSPAEHRGGTTAVSLRCSARRRATSSATSPGSASSSSTSR
ncbi:hypothetical protein BZL29_8287 [Mycobacterium kansasii]|uniref:Uncharacterized protein n=1 Tax=Mycobacterium kansasii TaxID=1768 RepID=A0A1V3WCD0_MYCKA|nr:hypothetical protein BZL29_8287 [Mycobacterium kansasii]